MGPNTRSTVVTTGSLTSKCRSLAHLVRSLPSTRDRIVSKNSIAGRRFDDQGSFVRFNISDDLSLMTKTQALCHSLALPPRNVHRIDLRVSLLLDKESCPLQLGSDRCLLAGWRQLIDRGYFQERLGACA